MLIFVSFFFLGGGFFCKFLQDKSSTSNLKIEALIFTRLVLASHSPSVFHPYINVRQISILFSCLFKIHGNDLYHVIMRVSRNGPQFAFCVGLLTF